MSHIRFLIFLLVFLFGFGPPRVQAADALTPIQTGLAVLDAALNEAAYLGARPQNQSDIIREISFLYGLTEPAILALHRQGYNYGEIYYIALLHRQTGLPVETILNKKSQGIGWGEMAHRLEVQPSELNKTRVALKKAYKPGQSFNADQDPGRPPSASKEKKNKPDKNEAGKSSHGKGKGKKK